MVRGEILYKNGDEYSGELSQGKMNGQGVYKFKNGSFYQGQFKDDLFQGRGKLIDKLNDLTIVGEFVKGQPNGYGRVVYADGSEYEGPLKNGLRNGKGVYKYPIADAMDKYQGLFCDDAFEGYGELTFKNKSKYKGEFYNNLFQGQGEFTTEQFVYVGQFKQGRIEGKGLMKFENGQHYEGEFELGKRNGRGSYHYKDGSEYVGQWKQGKRHGKGRIKHKNGNHFEAEFENDVVVGQVISKIGQFDIVAEVNKQKLHGPISITTQDTKMQANYVNGQKNGRVLVQKQNKYGQTVTYRGEFKDGRENPYTVSYSHRF